MPKLRTLSPRCLLPALLLLTSFSAPIFGQAGVPVESFELDNGMKFLVVERPQLATVSAGWVAHVGSANERPGITGLAHLFEHMMFKGSKTIGTTDIERDLEIINEQEEIQEKVRAIYKQNRERWRKGELESPYDPENRSEEMKQLQAEFQKLVEEQRSLMVKDEFSNIYTNGGVSFINAFTNNDVTVYVATLPANKMELWYWMESERLHQPVFREFYSERDVVYEERRLRTESTPTGEFDEQLNAMFWAAHPYSWPIVGWASDLRVISKAQADTFFDTYYAPNNLTAVLVGNITVESAKELAERYFGRLERGKVEPPDVVTLESEQLAEKRMDAECDCPPQIQILYHSVPFGHRDDYVFDVLGGVLNGRTGRLYKAMIEGSEIASQAFAAQDSQKYAGSFGFSAEAKGDHSPAEIEAAWDAVVADLAENPVPETELDKVKNIVTADVYRRLDNPLFLMIQLCLFDGMGNWQYLNTLAERTAAVTAEDVQRVVKQYLVPENRLVGSYLRKAGSKAQEIPPELTSLPAPMQQQILQQAKQLQTMTDSAMLEQALGQMDAQVAQVPADMKPAFDYMKRLIQERLAELDSKDGDQ